MEKTEFQKENDQLLQFVLENRFFNVWRDKNAPIDKRSLWDGSNVELFITAACNLKCEYCYLQRHGEKLYPAKISSPDTIISNMRALFDWFVEEDFHIKNVDLFSGEIWHTDFGFRILDVILEYAQRGLVWQTVTIPTNCSFVLNDNTLHRMQNYIDRFAEAGMKIIISCSVEGKVLESTSRPMASGEEVRYDDFYDRVFTFAKKNHYLFHPMVASTNVKQWIDNLKWYEQAMIDYEIQDCHPIMMLEVRNGGWDDESISDLLKYYDYEIDQTFEKCGNDVKRFANVLIGKDSNENHGYMNFALPLAENHPGCTIPTQLCVRLGDLAICPCHRTSYDKFLYGKFDLEDGKISGITAINPQMAIRVLGGNNKIAHHGCDVCPYSGFCMRGCFGAQCEYENEPFMPIPSVCKMFMAKYDHLIDRYEEMGVLDEWRKISQYDTYYGYVQTVLRHIDEIQAARKGGRTA